jgi:peptidoglycan/xylan/chitin deacetylase (PgdA/CDA1 family)
MAGHLLISLDFELHWGVRDHTAVDGYRANLLGVRQAVPRLLDLLRSRGVRATWAVVGMLLARDKDELQDSFPRLRPRYRDARLDPYAALGEVGRNELEDPFHYAPSLVRLIADTPGQEVGTHTFSHFYALEEGAGTDAFVADLEAARAIMARHGLAPRSIVFPRNQYAPEHVQLLPTVGIVAYRGSARGPWNRPTAHQDDHLARRALRLVDSYVPLAFDRARPRKDGAAVDLPASRFLRPYSPTLAPLDPVRFGRLALAMTGAARAGADYHLWWHPHNFGAHLDENLAFLSRVLDHYGELSDRYGMRSVTMAERAATA